jgi:hypothetical protein
MGKRGAVRRRAALHLRLQRDSERQEYIDVPSRKGLPGRALEREAWQFYTGASWNADWRQAKPVLRLDRDEAISVHWSAYLKKYLAICTSPIDRLIRLRVASRPEGPWSQPLIRLDLLNGRPSDTSGAYAAAGHPELARDGGRFEYITYPHDGVRVLEIEFK